MCKWVLYSSVDAEVNFAAVNSQVYSACVHAQMCIRGSINYTGADRSTEQALKIETYTRNSSRSTILQYSETK